MTSTAPVHTSHVQRPSALGAVDKAMVVLNAIIADSRPMSLAELTRRTGLAKPTVHRLLATLRAHQMVDLHDDRYVLTARLANRTGAGSGDYLETVEHLATPHLVDLHHASGMTASLAVLDCCEVLYVDRIYGRGPAHTPPHRSDRAPAHTTAIGRALLANPWPGRDPHHVHGTAAAATGALADSSTLAGQLRVIRRTGVAYGHEEQATGVVCVAAPVLPGSGDRPPVSISLSGRTGLLDLPAAGARIRRAALALAEDIRRGTGLVHRAG
jgi:DNA-binding IclR family transcriptional regulator